MQRKLMALAVAGAFAVPGAAMAQVTISGQLRFSVDSFSWNDGGNAGAGVSKWGLTSHSSNIKFQSRESLGGGMTAWGVLENGVATGRFNAQNSLWNGRNSGIGLDTNWGTVMIGIWDSPYKSLDGVWSIGTPAAYSYSPTAPIFGNGDTTGGHPNPNCGVNESGAGYNITASVVGANSVVATVCANTAGSATSFQRRLNNTFQYWSPVWNGLQFLVATQGNEEKTAQWGNTGAYNPKLWSLAARWTGARWGLVLGYETHKDYQVTFATTAAGVNTGANTGRNGTDKGTKIGGNYDFGVVQLGLAHERIRIQNGTNAAPTDLAQRNTAIQLAAPIGNGAVRGGWARSRQTGSGNANGLLGTDTSARIFNLSYEHNLSKRTLVYIAYAKLRLGDGRAVNYGTSIPGSNGFQTTNLSGQDPRTISFGMNHTF